MIAFRLSDGFLELSEETQVSLTISSPFFDPEHLLRVYTFDFVVPKTPRNNQLLQHIYRIDSTAESTEIDCDMYIEGLYFESGKLSVQEIGAAYSCYFQSDTQLSTTVLDAELASFMEVLPLYTEGVVPFDLSWLLIFFPDNGFEADFLSVVIIEGHHIETWVYWDYGVGNYAYSTAANNLLVSIITEMPWMVGFVDVVDNGVSLRYTRKLGIEAVQGFTFTPMFQVARYDHFRIREGVMSLMDNLAAPVIFPPVRVPNINRDIPIFKDLATVNTLESNGNIRFNVVENQKQWANTLIPMVKVSYILERIALKLGVSIDGTAWNDAFFKKLFLFNSVTLDEVVEWQEGGESRFLNKWKNELVIGNHVPKMTAKSFLAALSRQFGIYYVIEGNTLSLNWKKDLLALTPDNWTLALDADSVIRTPIKRKGLRVRYEHDKDSPTFPSTFDPVLVGAGGTDFVLDFDTLTNFDAKGVDGFQLMPYWGGESGQTPMILLTSLEAIFFDDPNLTYIRGRNRYLETVGSTGFYEQYLKPVIEYEESEEVKGLFALTVDHLRRLNKGEMGRIFAFSPVGFFEGYVSEINVKLDQKKIGFSVVKMRKL